MRVEIKPVGSDADIDALKAHCLAFCNAQPGRSPSLSIAKTKVEEFIYHLRHHRDLVVAAVLEGENTS